jgi:polyisoprenyl-teichoic acid--peptidoglycan teichoic acid transferase
MTPPDELPRHRSWVLPARMLLGALIVTVLSGGAVATAGLLQVQSVVRDFDQYGHEVQFSAGTVTRAEAGKPQTILLVGSDHRYGDGRKDARSDTLMLLRIDPREPAISVLSIPRDLAAQIPGHGLQKINEAYSLGGLDLTTRTVKALLSTPGHPFRVNHAVATTFGGFVDAVNHIGCVYVDVDQRYYHSNAGLPPGARWSEIDVRAGYQQLCGSDALAYVRFRHLDNDIVRAARQQGFLRAAKDQVREAGLLRNLRPLVRIFAKATESDGDLQSARGILRLAKLAVRSSGKPVAQINFPATFVAPGTVAPYDGLVHAGLGAYVVATPEQVQTAERSFLHPRASGARAAASRAARQRGRRRDAGLRNMLGEGKALVRATRTRKRTRMPIYVPRATTARGSYPASTTSAPNPRRYVLEDPSGRKHAAYRLVIAEDETEGQYYGVQGTTWRDPPILAPAHATRRIGGRTFSLYTDAGRIRLVAWSTPKAVYWVSNTLSQDLSNRQMLSIAASTIRVRR